MTPSELDDKVNAQIEGYLKMRKRTPNSSLYRDAMWQYAEMAHGGTAMDGQTCIRDEYYPGYPDEFFFRVLSGLGEFDRYLATAAQTKHD